MSQTRRQRLHVDVPEAVSRGIRETAEVYYRGATGDAVQASLAVFSWVVRQRQAGRRVIAVDADHLPAAFEEPIIPGLEEALAPRWQWLVARPHPWRRQLAIKGRRLLAGRLARTIEANGWSADRAATEFDVPVAAVLEAQRYAAEDTDLLAAEEREERLLSTLLLSRADAPPPNA
ncbi:MAG: hypothetical protein M3406_00040 [Chloroflexota bacterium]|nr:hypothetical protein [Chloroflexota bacterium]